MSDKPELEHGAVITQHVSIKIKPLCRGFTLSVIIPHDLNN